LSGSYHQREEEIFGIPLEAVKIGGVYRRMSRIGITDVDMPSLKPCLKRGIKDVRGYRLSETTGGEHPDAVAVLWTRRPS
jgi:hypothetical protein